MSPARVNNVPEASRKSCEARPSGVSVSGGWCETPSASAYTGSATIEKRENG